LPFLLNEFHDFYLTCSKKPGQKKGLQDKREKTLLSKTRENLQSKIVLQDYITNSG
jgi:hypothetical protein